jgi:hypothetical protein
VPAANARGLSTNAKIGISVAAGALFLLAVFLALLEVCYFRRKRRERAVLNAIEQVERGGGVDKGSAHESEERIVLESRVSIVFDDGGENEEDGVEDGYEGEGEDEYGDDETDGGRNGMSLPRRVYE